MEKTALLRGIVSAALAEITKQAASLERGKLTNGGQSNLPLRATRERHPRAANMSGAPEPKSAQSFTTFSFELRSTSDRREVSIAIKLGVRAASIAASNALPLSPATRTVLANFSCSRSNSLMLT